jgi:hypothetical protein
MQNFFFQDRENIPQLSINMISHMPIQGEGGFGTTCTHTEYDVLVISIGHGGHDSN